MATALQTPAFGFTPEQHEERKKHLGASEIPVVAGYIPFKSPLQLWAEKRGLVAPFDGNEFTEWGNRLEAVIADKYAEVVGRTIVRSDTIVCPRLPWRSATPDRLVLSGTTIERGLEIKCRGAFRDDDWGEPGTDEVPNDVAIQCHWSMSVTGLKQWDVATLIGGNKFRMYSLHADDTIAESLIALGWEFWQHVVNGTEPPIDSSNATYEWLQRKFPRHRDEELRDATDEEVAWLSELLDVRERIKVLEQKETGLKNLLVNALGEAAGLVSPIGKATWKAPNGMTVGWKSVVDELAAQCGLPNDVVLAAVAKHATPMGRRFLPTPPSKNKGAR